MRPDTFERVRIRDLRALVLLVVFFLAGFLPATVHGQALQLAEVQAGDDYIEAVRASRALILHLEGPE